MGKIRLVLPVCPPTNTYMRVGRGGKLYVTDKTTAYKQEVSVICYQEGVRPLTGDLVIEVVWFRPKKSGDVDNRLKVLLDSLQGHAYLNDNQIARLSIERQDSDPKHPRMVVTISQIEDYEAL